jgi:prepilin-type N-terminal cleavage/methylation domain-containing protein
MILNPVHKNNQKAFTLVEILVVITVIGLLSSIIFAITRGADEQGRIARGLYFSQHLHNSLGSYVAGIWNFDEGSDTTANDTSGWENDGSLVNSPTWRCASTDTSYTPSAQGCSLEFNGVNSYVNVLDDMSLNIAGTITIEAWVKFNSITQTSQSIVAKNTSSNTGYWLFYNRSDDQKFGFYGVDNKLASSATTPSAESWTHVVAIREETDVTFYINGILDIANNIGGIVNPVSYNPLRIGVRSDGVTWPFNGFIDEVRIYSTALTANQIKYQYYAGLERLLAKNQINQDEYRQRLAQI